MAESNSKQADADQEEEKEDELQQRLVKEKEGHKHLKIRVNRPVYTQAEFDKVLEPSEKEIRSAKNVLQKCCSKVACSGTCVKKAITKAFPFLTILKGYSLKEDFVGDIVSGLTVGVMHIPQGMAYGMLTNLPPVYGLYVSFFPVLFYFFFGHSRHNSMGTFAVVSLMVGTVVDKGGCESMYRPEDGNATTVEPGAFTTSVYDNITDGAESMTVGGGMSAEELRCKVGWAMAVSLMAGVYQLAMGIFQLGFITIYMSEPLTRAFTTAAAVYVFTSQVKHVLGISTTAYSGPLKLVYTYIELFKNITSVNFASLIMSVICMVIIYLTKEFINPRVKKKIRMPFPIELVVIIFGTLISYLASFSDLFGMKIVGTIPFGIPPPTVPPSNILGSVAGDAFGIAIVAFAVNVSMGNLFAKKHSYILPANQELVAAGITNIASAFFNSYASAASLSRSVVQDNAGGKTQVAGLVSCCFLLLVLFGVGPLFENLPNNVLAAIVIVNLKGMFMQFLDLKKLWRISKYDCAIWVVTFLCVVVVDVDLGLFMGVGFSLLTVVFRTQSPYTCTMGRVPHTDIYRDTSVYKGVEEIPGIKIIRFESSLYYANTDHFVSKTFQHSGLNPRKLRIKQVKVEKKKEKHIKDHQKKAVKSVENHFPALDDEALDEKYPVPQPHIKTIIIDCSAMSYIDSVAVTTLSQVIEEYKAVGVGVLLSSCKAAIRDMLEVAGFFHKTSADSLFFNIHDAVLFSISVDDKLRQQVGDERSRLEGAESLYKLTAAQSFTSVNINDSIDLQLEEPLIVQNEV